MMTRIAIFGAGGHGITVVDALSAGGWFLSFMAFLDDVREGARASIPIIGKMNLLHSEDFHRDYHLIVAVGHAQARSAIAKIAIANGARMVSAIHPLSNISKMSSVGIGSYVAPFANIGAEATVGRYCVINTGAMVGHDCNVMDGASVNDGTVLGGGVVVEEEADIGMNVSVLPRVRIGKRSKVGAGSVVTRDVPADTIVKGVPAK